MVVKIILIIEIKGADNDKAIGKEAKLISIAEMAIDILLLNFMVCGCGRGHRRVGCLVRVVGVLKMMGFCICFQLADDTICVFGVVFGDIGFNPGCIEQEHRSQIGIYFLADRFRDVNETVKYGLQVGYKILFKPCDFGGVRNFCKTAEFSQMPGIMEENKQEESVGMEKRRWMISAQSMACRGYFRFLPVEA